MNRREPSWRLFAAELNQSTEDEKGVGERAASYVVSPLGARMNRVLLTGTLSTLEPVGGGSGIASLWRTRLTDPSGSVSVTAGSFQPRALAALRETAPGTCVLLVGKAHLYRSAQGVPFPSVRAEALRPISDAEHRLFLVEALAHYRRRRRLREVLTAVPPPSGAELEKEGFPARWVSAARLALTRYPTFDGASLDSLESPVRAAISGEARAEVTPTSTVRVTTRPSSPPRPAPPDPQRVGVFLELVDSLSGEATDGYADLRDALRLAQGKGLSTENVEEILNRLEEDGVLEEPIVGKLRRA